MLSVVGWTLISGCKPGSERFAMTKFTYAVLRGAGSPEMFDDSEMTGDFEDFAPTVGYPMAVLSISAIGLPNANLLVGLPHPFTPEARREVNVLATSLAGSEVRGIAVLAGPQDEHQRLTSLPEGWIERMRQ
jgi:hypothetical protein